MVSRPDLEIRGRDGITVRRLMKLLEGAHPDARVIISDPFMRKAKRASLDVTSRAQGSKPIVIIE